MPERFTDVLNMWGLTGAKIGICIGFLFEVFLIRNGKKVRPIVSILSIIAMAMFGQVCFELAQNVFPESAWKPAFYTLISVANTWWFAQFALSGNMFRLLTSMVKEKFKLRG